MTCPQCGGRMEEGRLTAGGYWIRRVPKARVDLLDAVTISRLSLRAKGTSAWICQGCRKVIADY